MKWIPLKEGSSIPEHGQYMVTRILKNGNGKPIVDVTLANVGWTYSGNGVRAYSEVKPITEDKTGWKSEYYGDDMPNKNDWYLVSLQKQNRQSITLSKLYFDVDKYKWLAVPSLCEVIAFMPYPKPYIQKGI